MVAEKYGAKLIRDLKRFQIEQHYKSNKREGDCWLFGEWFGKRCNDNSFFLANYVAKNHPQIHVFWVACDDTDVSALDKTIHIIRYDSEEAMTVFKRAGVVIMNQGYIDFSSKGFNYFRGAVTLNLWHGVAWKKIGHDKAKSVGLIHNLHIRVFDYFEKTEKYVSLSRRFSDVLHSAFHAADDEIIQAGYPRNSYFYSSEWLTMNRESILNRIRDMEEAEVSKHTKILLYMPTFRDKASQLQSLEAIADTEPFLRWMEENDVIVVQKAHFVSQQRNEFQAQKKNGRVLTINDIAPYEALGAADILITDYSSCFFDYLVLNRPIIHYIYDFDAYRTADRGVYYERDDVICGKAVTDMDGLKQAIIDYVRNPEEDKELRLARKKQFAEYETSDSCSVIFNIVNQSAQQRFS